MRKLNKKGFTLIEMLVVIAIIAILVSIIVPVVGNSTTKAAAATNAANLRSVAAEVAIKHLEDPVNVPAGEYTAVNGVLTIGTAELKAPVSKSVNGVVGKEEMKVVISAEDIIATYKGLDGADLDVDKFADVADNGKADGSNGSGTGSSTGGEGGGGSQEPETVACPCTAYDGSRGSDCSCGHSKDNHEVSGPGWNPTYGKCTATVNN